jgi:hypothetical protein
MTTQGGTCTYTKTVVIENTQPFNIFTNPIGGTCGNPNGQVTVYVDTPGTYTYQVTVVAYATGDSSKNVTTTGIVSIAIATPAVESTAASTATSTAYISTTASNSAVNGQDYLPVGSNFVSLVDTFQYTIGGFHDVSPH